MTGIRRPFSSTRSNESRCVVVSYRSLVLSRPPMTWTTPRAFRASSNVTYGVSVFVKDVTPRRTKTTAARPRSSIPSSPVPLPFGQAPVEPPDVEEEPDPDDDVDRREKAQAA